MHIALAQLNQRIGDFEGNLARMKRAVRSATTAGAELIVFGELATCGYPPRDFLEFSDFIHRCDHVVEELMTLSHDIGIIVGTPTVNPDPEGKDLFNSAHLLHEGRIVGTAHKTLLPTYDIFDEYRYFEPAHEHRVIEWNGLRLALTVCEDIWNIHNENPLYRTCPMDVLAQQAPNLMINLSASPFSYSQAEERKAIVRANSDQYRVPVIYVNHVGAQTDIVFDGGSLVANDRGEIVTELPYFTECIEVVDVSEVPTLMVREQGMPVVERIRKALVTGIRDYFAKLGFEKAVLGLSGGVDSALVLALAVEALGRKNVLSILMPSQYSSDHSVQDAIDLAENLGSPYRIVPIENAYFEMERTLADSFEGTEPGIAEENIQARLRGMILMAHSNKFGHILLNTSNKSEMAVGYGTLYGDMCGGLSVIGDLYKTQVYEVCEHINEGDDVIPRNILEKPPSAELRPNQKDTDSLPEYDELDAILMEYIEGRRGPDEIIAREHDADLVARTLRMVNMSEWKRHQLAPVIRVSPKAFGMGRRMPIVARYLDRSAG